MTKQDALQDLIASPVSRRRFARIALASGFTFTSANLIDGNRSSANAQGITDTDILNFALNLEYMESEFYTLATAGVTIDRPPFSIPISGVGTPGPTSGMSQIDLGGDRLLEQTILELAFNERAHVLVLRAALGNAAIAKPAINFAPLGATNFARLLQVGRVFEDTGVTAYGGAAPLIQSKEVLALAVRAALAEGVHIGNIRFHLAQKGIPDLGPVDNVDIIVGVPPRPGARLITVDTQGLTQVRTPSQILSILYGPGAPQGTSRGFLFPNGVNGNIRTV